MFFARTKPRLPRLHGGEGFCGEIVAAGPWVLGYVPEMGPGDSAAVMPALERLMEYNEDKELVPFLAESVIIAKDLKSMTFKLRKGIKFHDGSEMNADAVAWNFQMKETKRLQFDDRLAKIEGNGRLLHRAPHKQVQQPARLAWGWTAILSKQAFEKAGGGNLEEQGVGKANPVGTGPFKLAEYKVDNYIKWVRNENYWQPGSPTPTALYVRYVPDPVTALPSCRRRKPTCGTAHQLRMSPI